MDRTKNSTKRNLLKKRREDGNNRDHIIKPS